MSQGYWTGKKRSEETKRKVSEAQKGRKQPTELVEKRAAGNRKHGKSRQCYNYKEWRRKILERDNGKCVKCQRQHEKMHCHHIVPWKENEELRFSVDNGETLCAACHIKIGKENQEIDGENTQFKKGQSSWIFGKTHSEETRKKLSESLKGHGIGNQRAKGHTPWNKGKPMTEELRKKVSESLKGKTPNMRGKKHTEESKRKNREAHLGKRNSPETEFKKGEHFSTKTEFKKGMTPWNKGLKIDKTPWNKGKKHSEETKMKIREALKFRKELKNG